MPNIKPYQKLKSLFGKTPEKTIKLVLLVWLIGFVLRLIFSFTNRGYIDYWEFRLPIARGLAEGGLLYRDVPYNHMPIYPYLSAIMYLISPNDPVLTSAFIRFPMVVFDSLVPLGIVILMRSLKQVKVGIWASAIYALNPISIYEIGLSHWDGIATFFVLIGLAAIINGKMERAGLYAGLGFTIKQFPLSLLLFGALYTRKISKTLRMTIISAVVILAILATFLIICPEEFFNGVFNHPVHQGTGSDEVLIGTVSGMFNKIGLESGKLIWGLLFGLALLVPMLKVSPERILPFCGLTFVMLSIFFYVTHRQMIVWLLPFVFILLVTRWRVALIPTIFLAFGYLIRVTKPHWAWGFLVLIAGVWFYILFYIELNDGKEPFICEIRNLLSRDGKRY